MRYIILTEQCARRIHVWEDKTITHLAYIQKHKIPLANLAAAGNVLFSAKTGAFKITEYSSINEDPSRKQANKELLLSYMQERFGNDLMLRQRLAVQLNQQLRQNAAILKKYPDLKRGR